MDPVTPKESNPLGTTPAVPPAPTAMPAPPGTPTQPPVDVPLPSPAPSHAWLWYTVAGVIIAAAAFSFLYFVFGHKAFAPGVEEKKPVVIGGVLPLSGDAASFGIPIQQAALLAGKEINAAGGMNGRLIEWRFEDGKCETEPAKVAAENLLADGKVEFMIAGACSGEFLGAGPVAQSKGVLSFSSSATNPEISKIGNMVFRTAPSDALAGLAAARYAKNDMQATAAAIVYENTDYARGLHEVFSKSFTDLGGTIVADEMFEGDRTDFSAIVGKLKTAAPDVIYVLPQSPTPGIIFVKAAKEAQIPAQFLTADVLLIRDSIAEQGEILEGVTGIEPYFDEENAQWKDFIAKFTAEYGDTAPYPPDVAGVRDFMFLLKEAVEATDGTPAKVAEYFHNVRSWKGAVGLLTFDANGDNTGNYRIIRVANKQVEVVNTILVGS